MPALFYNEERWTMMKSITKDGRYFKSSRRVTNLISMYSGVSQKGSASHEFPVKFPDVRSDNAKR
jgi:hypothetical protein